MVSASLMTVIVPAEDDSVNPPVDRSAPAEDDSANPPVDHSDSSGNRKW